MPLIQRLRWVLRRASVMSPAEVAWRVRQAAGRRLARLGPRRAPARLPDPASCRFVAAAEPQLFRPPLQLDPARAEALAAGRIPVYGRWVEWRDAPAFWHTDPLSGAAWPRAATGRIDYRPGNPVGDVRLLWELNRLQHLVPLAAATADAALRPRAAASLSAQLRSWAAANPPGQGANHASAMEQALRIVAVCHAYDLSRGHLEPAIGALVAELVTGHAAAVEPHLSLYSSAGNHTIAEAAGLLYAGLLFEEHPSAARWARLGLELLGTEGHRQVNPDGGSLEQAPWYLLFVTDLLGLAQALLRHRGRPAVPELDGAVARARAFLRALAASPEELPAFGDSDGGWALGPELRLSLTGPPQPQGPAVTFRESGLTAVAPAPGERLLFLHGPLGMAPSYGHGHAACLSVQLRHRGEDLLVDPGTYLYGGPPALRRYFRSTAAHNTLEVAGRDQATQLTAFMWRDPWRARLAWARRDGEVHAMLGWHDGYRALGVAHWRGVAWWPGRFLAVWDRLEAARDPGVAIHWHLGCPAVLDAARGEVRLSLAGGGAARLVLPPGPAELLVGREAPPAGWRSPGYGSIEPCATVRSRPEGGARPEAVTVLWLEEGEAGRPALEAALARFRAGEGGG